MIIDYLLLLFVVLKIKFKTHIIVKSIMTLHIKFNVEVFDIQ